MTDDQWTYLDGYVRDLADRMGLRDWRVMLSREPCDQDDRADAKSFLRNAANQSTIYLAEKFADETAIEQRETLVHELIHPHFNRQDRVVDMYEDYVPRIVWETIHKQYRETQDVAVESLVWLIAPFMPPCELPREES